MKTDIDILKKKAVPILKGAGVKRSSFFGSVVRGEEKRGSDIDMLIEPPKGMSLFGFYSGNVALSSISTKIRLGKRYRGEVKSKWTMVRVKDKIFQKIMLNPQFSKWGQKPFFSMLILRQTTRSI